MKKFIAAVIFSVFLFFAIGAVISNHHQSESLAADNDYRARLGMMGVAITYKNQPQTWEYKYLCQIFKKELGQILSRNPLNLPERFLKVHLEESLKEPTVDNPAIIVSLDEQPICWVRISQLGTPEQIRGFVRFASELIFNRLKESSDREDASPPKKTSL